MGKITNSFFGKTDSNEQVRVYTLKNSNGMQIDLLNFGCAIQSIFLPLKCGKINVVLGFGSLKQYIESTSNMGRIAGLYANRIKNSEFSINGKTYRLIANEGNNHLHGTLASMVFNTEYNEQENSVTFFRTSPDGEDGFPGNKEIRVRYSLLDTNELVINYECASDADTHINLTNHSYFNLNGDNLSVLNHKLQIFSDSVTENDEFAIPTGKVLKISNTPFDFTNTKEIGADMFSDIPALKQNRGYNCNYVLNNDGHFKLCAEAKGDKSNVSMKCYTDQPGVQLYIGNYLDLDKAGNFDSYCGFCLETQHYPDSPHFDSFPSTLLKAGETFNSTTIYAFSF